MCLNHLKITPPTPSMKILPSTKLILDAKKPGDH